MGKRERMTERGKEGDKKIERKKKFEGANVRRFKNKT